jgi:electron transport complex protein RnfA
MTDLLLLALGASLVNNFVLTNFLGLCPFVGVSRRFEAAAGMALATLFVLTLASGLSYSAYHWLLEPLGLEYLRTLVFILLIAAVVQLTELVVRATSPLLHELLGVFLPLITTNCAVLGVALLNLDRRHGFVESLVLAPRPPRASVSRCCCSRPFASASTPVTYRRPFAARRSPSSRRG